MEYIFGINNDTEILKTKGDIHTNLNGFHQIEQVYRDKTVIDNFHIVCKTDSKEDVEGNCYDWYEIDCHYRVFDKTGPITKQMNADRTNEENAMCELDEMIDERISAIENAICELDELLNGGTE